MLNEQRTGPQTRVDGSVDIARADKTGASVVTGAHGQYAEASIRKNLFFSYCAARATSVPATSQIGNIIWNPPGSGVNLSMLLWTAQIQVTSATTLGITIGYSAQATTPGTTASDAAGSCYLDASSPTSGKAKASAIATLTTAPTPVMNLFHTTAAIATTGVDQMHGDFEGLFTIPPGYAVALSAITAAVAAVGMTSTLTWEEIPV